MSANVVAKLKAAHAIAELISESKRL